MMDSSSNGSSSGGCGSSGVGSDDTGGRELEILERDATTLKRVRVRLVTLPTDGVDCEGTVSSAKGHRPGYVSSAGGEHHAGSRTEYTGGKQDRRGSDTHTRSIPCVCVTGFHHTGTTLLRHMLGSHPDAYELPAEIAPTHAKLRRLRKEAEDRGAKVVIIKQPALNARIVRSLEKICREDPDFHIVKIRRNLPDTIYSLSLRFHQALQSKFTTDQIAAYHEVYSALSAHPEVMLERLSAEPEHTLRTLCASLNTGHCHGDCDRAATSGSSTVLPFNETMLLYYQNELRVDNRGRRTEIMSLEQSQEEENHDARRVRQINSTLHYELHPWREKLRNAADIQFLNQLSV